MKRWWWFAGAVPLIAAVLFALWPEPRPGAMIDPAPEAALTPAAPLATALPAVPGSAPSLRGTELDGAIGWDPDGSVRLDRALRRRFDHLLSAIGERSLPQIRAGLAQDLAPIAAPASARAVLEVFDRYTDYLAAVTHLQVRADESRVAALHRLRLERLGQAITRAFFEDEERDDAWALERQALLQRTDLSEAQRKEALEALDAKMPADRRDLAAELSQLQGVMAQTAALEASGATAEEKRAAREALVGAAAAQRLETLDRERERWAARVDAYRQRKLALEAKGPLDEAARSELQQLLLRDFDENERRRVQVLVP